MKLHILLICGFVGYGISIPLQKGNQENSLGLCTSTECIGASYRILKGMNRSADPCDDFYEFACGKFMVETRIPDDQSSWSSFEPLEEIIYDQGRTLLEEEISEDDFESYKLAKNHYKACTNEEKLQELGVEPLLIRLKEFGGWPVLDGEKWEGEAFTWWDWTYKMNAAGYDTNSLVELELSSDDKNTTWRVIKLDQADLGLSREYLVKGFDDKDVQHYYRYMVEMAILLGAEKEQAETELKESLLFEIELAHVTAPKEERRNATALYNPTTAGKIPTSDGLPPSWTEYIQKIFQLVSSIKIDENETVVVATPEYLVKLGELIAKTDKRTLANYLAWRVVKFSATLLNEEARKIRQKYRKAIKGVQAEFPVWKRCVEEVGFNTFETSNFIYVASSMYVRRYFKPEAKQEMIEMVTYIRNSFNDIILANIDWMDDNIKKKAKLKLANMAQFIAYQDEYLQKDKIDSLYEGLEISTDDFYGNALKLYTFWRIYDYNKLRQQVDIKSWKEHNYIALVNALYFPENNYMEFPAGILQGNFYTFGAPKYVNFASIGMVIGHEITHGFDDEGKQRNELGEIENWWDPSTEDSYKQKAQCIINQYGNYTSKQVDMKLNGINNQGENIADNGGLKEAYKAYRKWVDDNFEEPQLPGLPYTSLQMFWISYSQVWCTKYQDSALKELILTDYHSPGEFRVIGPLSNNEDFAKDFQCPVGSRMNPADKCAVW